MVNEDDVRSNVQESDGGSLSYGKADYKRLMPMVLKIMPNIPRDFLAKFIPDRSYRTFRAWQTGKRIPKDPSGLIEACLAWARDNTPNSDGLGARNLLSAYAAQKMELSGKVRNGIGGISDSVLHHKVGLNARTIAKLRKGQKVGLDVVRRVDELLTKRHVKPHLEEPPVRNKYPSLPNSVYVERS